MSKFADKTVLILGAGVHGAAIARELVLNGVGVHVVDKFDIAYGATSKSSRLIHGGLRYLEYGDFRLVKESLAARKHNLELAPQFVHELRLFIPTFRRWSGLWRSAIGFFGLSRTGWGHRWTAVKSERGYWPVRIGLWMYDRLGGGLAKSSAVPLGTSGTPQVNPRRYRWMCSYSDAQMLFPERLVVALLAEARLIAQEKGVPFCVSTYSLAEHHEGAWYIRDSITNTQTFIQPAYVVNATGAWGDDTLKQLQVPAPQQFGGTKGSHFVTWNEKLRDALQGQAVYAEADDGRLVFVLPFGDGVLVGTTDETFAARPETASATEEELEYLLELVNSVMDCRLTRDDIVLHYSGVRPLPKAAAGDNASVTRDHSLVEHRVGDCPVLTLVGGKLTTWREFSRQVSDRVFRAIGVSPTELTLFRRVLGSDGFPAASTERLLSLMAALWPLYGSRTLEILASCRDGIGTPIRGTEFTTGVVQWVIDQEWVRTLSDLVERRLMLVFACTLTRQTLEDLADCLVAAGIISPTDRSREIESTVERLATYYGRRVE